jgi:hypothetical protein
MKAAEHSYVNHRLMRFYFFQPRYVPIEELQNIVIRMGNLARQIICLERPDIAQHMVLKPLLDVPDGSNDR